jgi:hypothetical protein
MSNSLRSCRNTIVFVVALGAIASGQAQQATAPAPGQPATTPQQTPARTPPRGRPGEKPPDQGTAIIKGTIVAAESGAPLRRVSVRITSAETRWSGVTSTAADGRFEIKEIPAGRYTVSATKGSYVTLAYGQRRPGEPGTPIEVADGQTVEKVNFSMVKGGVMTGVLMDDTGEPMTAITVSVMRYQFAQGSRRLAPVGAASSRTDDTGTFRIYGLSPGEYYLNAQGGVGVGNIVVSTAGFNNEESFASTYYPGTPNIAEAQRLSVKVGQVLSGLNFVITPTRMASVRGRVLNSRGEPGRGMVMMVPDQAMMFSYSTGPGNNIGSDGSFLLPNIAPGRYNINVRPTGDADAEYLFFPITVGSEDIDKLLLTTGTGVTAQGVIRTDDGTPPPFSASDVQLTVISSEPSPFVGTSRPKINPDYSFELPSLFGRNIIRGTIRNQPDWLLKSVDFNGDEMIDPGIEFTAGGHYDDLHLVFTQKATELSGLITDSRGRPVVDASVVVFTVNKDRWVTNSRYLRTVRPDTEGKYNIKGLPPSEDYVIIAVQGLENGQGGDPEFLARAREEAKSLTLAEGEKKAFDVKLSTLVP